MTVLIISIILFVILAGGLFGLGLWLNKVKTEEDRYNGKRKFKRYLFLTCFAPLSFLILLFGTFCKVGANEVGIIYDDRYGVLENTIGEGFKTKSIFEHVTTISTSNRNASVETTGQTNDGQYATFMLSIIYKVDSENAGKFFKQTNSTELGVEQLNSLVKKSLQSSTIKFDIFELLSEGLETARIDFETDLKNQLMNNYYVTLVSVSFDDVDAGENIETILQSKAEAEQKIEIAKKQAEADLVTAQNEVEIAKQNAIVKQTLADAEAYAIKTQGEANAETATAYVDEINAMITNIQSNTGLTYEESADLVLSIVFYDTWDGKLPEVLTSDSLSSMIGGLISDNSTATE